MAIRQREDAARIAACKRQVVQRKAMNKYKADEAASFDGAALRAELERKIGERLTSQRGELAFAQRVGEWAAANRLQSHAKVIGRTAGIGLNSPS